MQQRWHSGRLYGDSRNNGIRNPELHDYGVAVAPRLRSPPALEHPAAAVGSVAQGPSGGVQVSEE
jgi:hypothetical protein